MSTSTYYSFLGNSQPQSTIFAHRPEMSPSSFDSSDSSSSLNHMSPTGVTSPSSTSLSSNIRHLNNLPKVEKQEDETLNNSFTRLSPFNKQNIIYSSQDDDKIDNFKSRIPASMTLQSFDARPLNSFKSNDGYLYAMKEDLSEWLNNLYSDLSLNVDNFMNELGNGTVLCRHANTVTKMGRNLATNLKTDNNNKDNGIQLDINKSIDANVSRIPKPNNIFSRSLSGGVPTSNNKCHVSNSCSYRNSFNKSDTVKSISPQSLTLPKSCSQIDWLRTNLINYRKSALPGTFFARDNICQFIVWCRSLNILDCLLFETDDLVLKKNERSFILCLLEIARIGFKVGMSTPMIIQLEQEIDKAIENDAKLEQQQLLYVERTDSLEDSTYESSNAIDNDFTSNEIENNIVLKKLEDTQNEDEESDEELKPQVITNDLVSLHERVVELLNMCTCPTQFPMVRISDGKYRVGDKLVIFLRILRNHIMVRVGGGWDTLEHYIDKHDPCRCKLQTQQRSFSSSTTKLTRGQSTVSPQGSISNRKTSASKYSIETGIRQDSFTEHKSASKLTRPRNNLRMPSSISMGWLPQTNPNSFLDCQRHN